MKYFILLGDGMADRKVPELGGLTPLEKAHKPCMDALARCGELGTVKTVPDHLNPPGSDIANMSVLGYDPDRYYTGRSPLEAVSMGVTMEPDDVAIRCNLVTLSDAAQYADAVMTDYSAGEISTDEAAELIRFLDRELGSEAVRFYPGVSYRHCLLLKHCPDIDLACTPPHDISERVVGPYLPRGAQGAMLLSLMERSRALLRDHPINRARVAMGLAPASSVWFWGQGRKPALPDFREKTGLRGAVISAVDLVKGLGLCAGMAVPDVPGATGTIDTNFTGKAQAAIDFLRSGGDLVYLHVEAPDECGHHREIENKVRAIEAIDARVLAPVWEALRTMEPYRILVLPDHPTPLALRTHTHDAVPYLLYDSRFPEGKPPCAGLPYAEETAASTGLHIAKGYTLMDHLIAAE